MGIFSKLGDGIENLADDVKEFFDGLFDTLSGWFKRGSREFLDGAKKVQEQIEEIGEEAFYAAINAGVAELARSGGVTGQSIALASDRAIEVLKSQGIQKITAVVFAAVATVLAELYAEQEE